MSDHLLYLRERNEDDLSYTGIDWGSKGSLLLIKYYLLAKDCSIIEIAHLTTLLIADLGDYYLSLHDKV